MINNNIAILAIIVLMILFNIEAKGGDILKLITVKNEVCITHAKVCITYFWWVIPMVCHANIPQLVCITYFNTVWIIIGQIKLHFLILQ